MKSVLFLTSAIRAKLFAFSNILFDLEVELLNTQTEVMKEQLEIQIQSYRQLEIQLIAKLRTLNFINQSEWFVPYNAFFAACESKNVKFLEDFFELVDLLNAPNTIKYNGILITQVDLVKYIENDDLTYKSIMNKILFSPSLKILKLLSKHKQIMHGQWHNDSVRLHNATKQITKPTFYQHAVEQLCDSYITNNKISKNQREIFSYINNIGLGIGIKLDISDNHLLTSDIFDNMIIIGSVTYRMKNWPLKTTSTIDNTIPGFSRAITSVEDLAHQILQGKIENIELIKQNLNALKFILSSTNVNPQLKNAYLPVLEIKNILTAIEIAHKKFLNSLPSQLGKTMGLFSDLTIVQQAFVSTSNSKNIDVENTRLHST